MTPEHIRQIAIAVKKLAPDVARVAARARPISDERPAPVEVIAEGVPAVPKAERSSFAQALSQGRFVTIVQLTPPKGFVGDVMIESARALKAHGVDVVHIPTDTVARA